MILSTRPYHLRLILRIFPALISITLILALTNRQYEILILTGALSVLWLILFFLLPNVAEVTLHEETIGIRYGQKSFVEPIENIDALTETFTHTNKLFSVWSFYRISFKKPTKAGNHLYFLTKKKSVTGEGSQDLIGELNYRIAVSKKSRG